MHFQVRVFYPILGEGFGVFWFVGLVVWLVCGCGVGGWCLFVSLFVFPVNHTNPKALGSLEFLASILIS